MTQWFLLVWGILAVILAMLWGRRIGFLRGFLAGGARFLWPLPVFLSLTPETLSKRIPGSYALQPIQVLLDDSESMISKNKLGVQKGNYANDVLKAIDQICLQIGCLPKVSKLSDLSPEVAQGFTPLSQVLGSWFMKVSGDPWVLLSDGGDFRPNSPWDESLGGISTNGKENLSHPQKTSGLIVSFGEQTKPGIFMDQVSVPSIAFESKQVSASVRIGRVESSLESLRRVQLQVQVDGQVVSAQDVTFSQGSPFLDTQIVFGAPKRGPHIVSFKALPISGESDLWDNVESRVIEVLPNTIGLLHLLGAPSWDGRFLRRYLKSEPKFDVISFFILRDPWDSQHVSEREMSLIPFPVERLFKEELASFRSMIMQNFNLMRFLQPEFQKNLAQFVEQGGGLLFIGGPRALSEADVNSSGVAKLFPFEFRGGDLPPSGEGASPQSFEEAMSQAGSTYDAETEFTVEMANPDPGRRALAGVYEHWLALSERLKKAGPLKGLHRMGAFEFHSKDVTPLLNARLKDGKVVPLAVASYPGKGRAIWIFSDSLWKLATTLDPDLSRPDYNQFLEGSIDWLTRSDMKGILSVRQFKLQRALSRAEKWVWQASLVGAAVSFLKSAKSVRYSICGTVLTPDRVMLGAQSGENLEVSGDITMPMKEGAICGLKIDWEHPAFGSTSVTGWTLVPETYRDKELGPSPAKLGGLAKLTGATLIQENQGWNKPLTDWLEHWGVSQEKRQPDKVRTVRNFYWPLDHPWIWLCLLFLPFEVIIRRWHLLMGGRLGGQKDP